MSKKEIKTGCDPIVKWVGGKRQLLSEIQARMPSEYGTYFEPFFGGGSLFFALKPNKAVINDFNSQLINMYQQIQKDYEAVLEIVDQYQNAYNELEDEATKSEYYYARRDDFNEFLASGDRDETSAALFIFLNKAAFNGVYRVNRSGLFNVPSARRATINAYQQKNVQEVAEALSKATILNGDFEDACKTAKAGDFVFFDSPYYDTFDTYHAGGFDEAAHRRLAALYKRLSDSGVKCMMTNSNTDFIKELYSDYNIEVVDVKRMINRDATNRVGKEVIVINYDVGAADE